MGCLQTGQKHFHLLYPFCCLILFCDDYGYRVLFEQFEQVFDQHIPDLMSHMAVKLTPLIPRGGSCVFFFV